MDKGNKAIKIKKKQVECKFARKSKEPLYFSELIAFIMVLNKKLEMRRLFRLIDSIPEYGYKYDVRTAIKSKQHTIYSNLFPSERCK